MSQFPETEGRSPFQRAKSLADLLSWHDLDFVRCAYVTMLGRQPDLPGQAHYVEQICAGHSKLEVLWHLRRSPEAKQHDPGLAGLDRALKRAAWQRRPILGAISRFLRADADGASRQDRALRAIANATMVNQSHILAIADRLSSNPALAGLHGSSPATGTRADRLENFHADSAKGMSALQTPELDHLRQKGLTGRFVDDVAP